MHASQFISLWKLFTEKIRKFNDRFCYSSIKRWTKTKNHLHPTLLMVPKHACATDTYIILSIYKCIKFSTRYDLVNEFSTWLMHSNVESSLFLPSKFSRCRNEANEQWTIDWIPLWTVVKCLKQFINK